MSSAQRRACRERRSRAARSEVYGCAVDAASPDGARFGQQLLQSARDGWSVGGAAFAVARGARSLRPYVAGALAVVLVVGKRLDGTRLRSLRAKITGAPRSSAAAGKESVAQARTEVSD